MPKHMESNVDRVSLYAYSHIGNARKNHEDNYLLGEQYMLPRQVEMLAENRKIDVISKCFAGSFCAAISDGMGGHECGEVASLLTVQYLSTHITGVLDNSGDLPIELSHCISRLNHFVCCEASQNDKTCDMGATVCGIVSSDRDVFCFNVGDSRLYQYANGLLKKITIDNTEGQRLLDLGLLTEEEVKKFPKRKALYKYIGKDIELTPDIYKLNNIGKGTLLFLCSDGFSDVLSPEEMQDVLSKRFIVTEDKGKLLVEMAVEKNPGAGDNITLIIIEY